MTTSDVDTNPRNSNRKLYSVPLRKNYYLSMHCLFDKSQTSIKPSIHAAAKKFPHGENVATVTNCKINH